MVTSGATWVPSASTSVTPAVADRGPAGGRLAPDRCAVNAVRVEQIAEDSGFSSLLYRVHLSGSRRAATCDRQTARPSPRPRGRWRCSAATGAKSRSTDASPGARRWARRTYTSPRMVEGTADFVLVLEDLQDWDNADHWPACRWTARGSRSPNWPACTLGRRIRRMPMSWRRFRASTRRSTRDMLLPAFGLGWQIYLRASHRRRSRPRSRAIAERFAELAPAGAGGAEPSARCCCTAISAPTTCSSPVIG